MARHITLTPGVDTLIIHSPDTVIDAPLVLNKFAGISENTLNPGDSIIDIRGDGVLDVTLGPLTTAPFVNPVTLHGIATANITSIVTGTAGFTGNITGLTAVNVVSSIGRIQLGGNSVGSFASQGLATALASVTLDANQDFTAVVAAAALAGTADAINVTINGNFGTKDAPNFVAIGPDSGATHGYESETIVLNGTTDFFALSQGPTGNSLHALTLTGGASTTVFADLPNNFDNLTSIDASAANNGIIVTGALTGVGRTTPLAGLLSTDTALTSLKFGAGDDTVDLTSFSPANLAALTADGGAGTDTMIVTDAVATNTSPATLAHIKDFEVLGIGGPVAADGAGGTINMALLPSSINEIVYQTAASGSLIINNQTGPLTIDTEDNGHGFAITVNAAPQTSTLSDSLHLIVGDATHSTAGAVGAVTLFGEESVTITSRGANGNTIGPVTLTPIPGTSVHVTIDGTNDITIGGPASSTGFSAAAIEALNESGGLDPNSLSITIGGGATRLGGFPPPGVVLPGDSAPLFFGTNALTIDASNSGGLIMPAGDANYSVNNNSFGDSFIGSTTAGNVLGGSIGNDSFSINNNSPNTIYTDGGGDTIDLLSVGHTAVTHIEFYAGYPTMGISPGGVEIPTDQSITENNDMAQIGWWGIPTSGTEAGYVGDSYAGLPAQTGTSADATIIFNFNANPGGDILDFGASADTLGTHHAIWGAGGANGLGGVDHGLVNGDFQPFVVPTGGTDANAVILPPTSNGPGIANLFYLATFNANDQLVPIPFTGPTDVAQALHDPSRYPVDFFFAGLPPGDSAHMLIVYQDSLGNTRIADLALANTSAVIQTSTTNLVEHVSDMAILLGVPLTELAHQFPSNVRYV
jgi:hypothetical protein